MASASDDSSGTPLLGRLETLTVVGVIGVLALALGLAGLAMSGDSTATKNIGYTQSGSFSYSATAPAASPYGGSGLATGQPILTQLVGPVQTSFAYELVSRAPTEVHGTASLLATVTLDQGFSREFVVAPPTEFTGNEVSIGGTLPVPAIIGYVTSTKAALGNTGGRAPATVTLTPEIEVTGFLGGRALTTSYSPALPFSLNGSSLIVRQSATTPSDGDQAGDVLTPSQQGTVDYQANEPATVPLLVTELSAPIAMGAGFGVAGLCLLLGLWLARPLFGDDPTNEPERIQALYASQLLPVCALTIPEGPVAEVASISALADLAKQYETKIMHVHDDAGDSYLLWDDGMLYRYRSGAAGGPRFPSAESSHPVGSLNGHPVRPRERTRFGRG